MKINQLKAGVLLSYLTMGLGTVISLLYTPIMLRLLGQNEYGLYGLVSTVVSYLGLLSFGFGSAYIRYHSIFKVKKDTEQIARLNGMFLLIFSIIGIIALFAGAGLVSNIGYIFRNGLSPAEIEKARILMAILVVNIALSFPGSIFTSYITANEKYVFLKTVNIIKTVLNPFVMLPVLLLGYKSVGMVVMTTILNIVVELLNFIYCIKALKMKFLFNRFDFALFKDMWVFSCFIFINMITDQINWSVDKFILGMYQGAVSVAVYNIAAQLNTYYMQFASSISSVFAPKINQMVAGESDEFVLTDLFTRVGRIQFILLSLLLGGLIIFGKQFIAFWAGAGYETSYQIALLLIIPVTIPLIQCIGLEIQRAKNMHQFRSVVYFIIAVSNIFVSIPLCRQYGAQGAAFGTAITLLTGNGIAMNLYYHKKVRLDIVYFWKQIANFIPSLIPPALLGFLILRFVSLENPFVFIGLGLVYIAVFTLSMWYFGMNAYEKDLLTGAIRKKIKK